MTVERRVLVLDANTRHRRWVSQIVKTVIADPEVRERATGPLEGPYDLVIASYDSMTAGERLDLVESAARGQAGALILLAESLSVPERIELFERGVLKHLLAVDGLVAANDLLVTLQKLLRRDLFGLDKYFGWGVEPRVLSLSRSSERRAVVAAAHDFAASICEHPRFVSLAATVVDELTSNALYDAPVDAQGAPRFASRSRLEEVELGPGEAIEVRLCSDGYRLGLSVSDPFGTLAAEKVVESLLRGYRRGEDQIAEKAGGAGLGLFHALGSLSHLVVNLSRGRKTELIGLLDIRHSYRDFASKGKSLNLFET